jgi:hypothetical protein
VRVEIEHRDGGPALQLLHPYRREGLGGSFDYGQLAAAPGQRRIWRDDQPT